jgi:hypothetical protein
MLRLSFLISQYDIVGLNRPELPQLAEDQPSSGPVNIWQIPRHTATPHISLAICCMHGVWYYQPTWAFYACPPRHRFTACEGHQWNEMHFSAISQSIERSPFGVTIKSFEEFIEANDDGVVRASAHASQGYIRCARDYRRSVTIPKCCLQFYVSSPPTVHQQLFLKTRI